jgi:DNA-binding XRE family transcriptional regulator
MHILIYVIVYDNINQDDFYICGVCEWSGKQMSKAGVKFSEVKQLLMRDEDFKAEYEKLKPRYDVISQIIEVRTSQNITQEELALRVGTQRSNISRLESGAYNPSLDFLIKVAQSLGKKVKVTLR